MSVRRWQGHHQGSSSMYDMAKKRPTGSKALSEYKARLWADFSLCFLGNSVSSPFNKPLGIELSFSIQLLTISGENRHRELRK